MRKRTLFLSALAAAGAAVWARRPLPDGLSFRGAPHPVTDIRFLRDLTFAGPDGIRRTEQEIFDEMFRLIRAARRLVLVDLFLYNDFQPAGHAETRRALCAELTATLVAQKQAVPDLQIIVITDPVNTVYGGLQPDHFQRLEAAGIPVVFTRLEALRDSNLSYSLFWRAALQWFGNGPAETVANPFGPGRVSLRSWLAMFNFKANHRKVLIADDTALVTSANPHDGSSAHGNLAVRFSGPAVADLLNTEQAVLRFSGGPEIPVPEPAPVPETPLQMQVLTERKIKDAALEELARCGTGDTVDLVMFYLSDRAVIRALRQAHARGAELRVLLDPNKDAFGFEKNGIPNRQTAAELHARGIAVRWADTHGEQCHSKMLSVRHADGRQVFLGGSANFTRRNLDNFNLETDVLVRGPDSDPFFRDVTAYADLLWNNGPERFFSTEYETYEDRALWKHGLYRFMEWSGMSSF